MGNLVKKAQSLRPPNSFRSLIINQEKIKAKILLLGTGEVGKTTLHKQLRNCYAESPVYSSTEELDFKRHIRLNIIQDCENILWVLLKKQLDLFSGDGFNKAKLLERIYIGVKEGMELPEFYDIFSEIWEDRNIRLIWSERESNGLYQMEPLEYFMMKINEIFSEDYIPSHDDIVRARLRTTGITIATFKVDNYSVEVFDTGGQRTERRKWIQVYGDTTIVMFVVSLAEYDEFLMEDLDCNRQEESLKLFGAQLNENLLDGVPHILFLNKNDLFREKLTRRAFRVANDPEILEDMNRNESFAGPHLDLSKKYDYLNEGSDTEYESGYSAALQYLIELYEAKIPTRRKHDVKTFHITNFLDTQNTQMILKSCEGIIADAAMAAMPTTII